MKTTKPAQAAAEFSPLEIARLINDRRGRIYESPAFKAIRRSRLVPLHIEPNLRIVAAEAAQSE